MSAQLALTSSVSGCQDVMKMVAIQLKLKEEEVERPPPDEIREMSNSNFALMLKEAQPLFATIGMGGYQLITEPLVNEQVPTRFFSLLVHGSLVRRIAPGSTNQCEFLSLELTREVSQAYV